MDSLRASSIRLEQQQPESTIHAPVRKHHSERATCSSDQASGEVINNAHGDTPQEIASPGELEISRRPAPQAASQVLISNSWRNPPINKWRVLSACMSGFGQGFNDSAPGALLPYIEQYYGINYAVVSTIFVANAVGFITAAFFVHKLDHKLGRAKTFILCEALNTIAFGIMIIPPPFPVFAIGYFITGFGLATALALNNVFCANTEPATTILGAYHGCYGLGGTIAPLIATAMLSAGCQFSLFFSLLLGIRVLVGVFISIAFWHWTDENQASAAATAHNDADAIRSDTDRMPTNNRTEQQLKSSNTLFPALKLKTTLIGALFIFAYQGAEVSISGWVISFLITVRHGDPSRVGNVTAGFWAGITVGRLLLSPLAQRTGEKSFTYFLLVGSVAFEVAVWKWQSIIGDSVFIALLGLLLGPIYPCATIVFTRLLPRNLQHTAMAFISSAGSSGGAIAPFVTGLLAQATGTWVLHPIAISLYVVMIVCWATLPQTPKRSE